MAGGDGEAATLNPISSMYSLQPSLVTRFPFLLPCRRSAPRAEAPQVLGAVESESAEFDYADDFDDDAHDGTVRGLDPS